jgi:acylphosphatase
MIKCLKIMLTADFPQGSLSAILQKHAQELQLEGVAQVVGPDNKISIIVCGTKDGVDEFLDFLHKDTSRWKLIDIDVEPFLTEKRYRGVFRIIE